MNSNNFKDEILLELNSRDNLHITFKKILDNIENFETIYFGEILSFESVYNDFYRAKQQQLITREDAGDLEIFFSSKRVELATKLLDEQEKILEENIRYIKKQLELIPKLLMTNEIESVIELYNELFTRIHSRYYSNYLKIISKEYDPIADKFNIYQNKKTRALIDLRDDILFEKELIHFERLTSEMYQDQELLETFKLLKEGQFLDCAKLLEDKYITFLSNSKTNNLKLNESFRKPTIIVSKLLKLIYNRNQGLLGDKQYYLLKIELVKEIIDLHEHNFRIGLATKISTLEKTSAKLNKSPFNKEIVANVKQLLGKAKVLEALDLLLTNIPNENKELSNEVLIQKARYVKNQENERLGVDFESNLNSKIIKGVLDLF